MEQNEDGAPAQGASDRAYVAAEMLVEKIRREGTTGVISFAPERRGADGSRIHEFSALDKLPPLGGLEWIHRIDLDGTQVSDLSPLAELEGLVELYLSGTLVSDLSPLARLDKLEVLELADTNIANLRPLKALKLRILKIGRSKVEDLSPLSDMTSLASAAWSETGYGLFCSGCPLSDPAIAALARKPNPRRTINILNHLRGLHGKPTIVPRTIHAEHIPSDGSEASDPRVSRGLELAFTEAVGQVVKARENGATSLEFRDENEGPLWRLNRLPQLLNLEKVKKLHLNDTQIFDLSPVAALKGLRELEIDRTCVRDLGPISPLKNLRVLSGGRNYIFDLNPLASLTELAALMLRNTWVSDLSPIAGLKRLKFLNVEATDIEDLSPLADLTGLEELYISDTNVRDLSPLARLEGLRGLAFRNTEVTDLAPLAGLSQLEKLDLSGTQVSDLASLEGLTNLRDLCISDTKVTSLAPLANLTSLVKSAIGRDSNVNGLHFEGCPILDPIVRDLAEKETPECTVDAIQYLRKQKGLPLLRLLPPVKQVGWKYRGYSVEPD